jgi:capsular polysaccharide transport system permease protein
VESSMTFADKLTTWNQSFAHQRRVIWALAIREIVTRYGRDNIGFLWVIGEPLLFCGAVSIMWSVIKPSGYERGVHIVPFIVTGYMQILLIRHVLQHGMYAVRVNSELLYHRQINILHLFFARGLVEFIGVTFAFIVICAILAPFGLIDFPEKLDLLYTGWFLLALMSLGMALMFGALLEVFEPIERFVSVITYMMVPLSGAFYMAAWIPEPYRDYILLVPFVNTTEMIRGGYLGDAVHVYYNIPYVLAWTGGFLVFGLVLSLFVRKNAHIA